MARRNRDRSDYGMDDNGWLGNAHNKFNEGTYFEFSSEGVLSIWGEDPTRISSRDS